MSDYGGQIVRNGLLDVMARPKSWAVTRLQYRILNAFEKMLPHPRVAGLAARVARRLVGGYPYSIKVEINDYCTLRCPMCYVDKAHHDLPLDRIIALLDALRGLQTRLEILGGEPIMRPDLNEIIRHAKQEARLPFVSLYTNGVLATPEVAQGLKAAGLDVAIVSLISHDEKAHDAFVGVPGSWQKTIAGIRSFREAGVEAYTFTSIHQHNYRDYQTTYNFIDQELHAHPLYYQYVPQRKDDPLMIDPVMWREIKHWVLYEKTPEHRDFVRDFYMLTGCACSGGNFVFTVKVDGTVQPCPFIQDIPLGNVLEDDFWTIFTRRYAQPLLRTFKSLPEECTGCSYASVCGGGCKAGNTELYGSYARRDHRCLGPFHEPLSPEQVCDRVPTFF